MGFLTKVWLGFWKGAHTVLSSALTGPDGKSYAPGRIMAAVVFTVAQCLVIKLTQHLLDLGGDSTVSVAEWTTYLVAIAGFEIAISGACVALVLGQAPADPGGKWWGKDATPPTSSPPAPPKEPEQ